MLRRRQVADILLLWKCDGKRLIANLPPLSSYFMRNANVVWYGIDETLFVGIGKHLKLPQLFSVYESGSNPVFSIG